MNDFLSWLFGFFCLAQISQVFNIRTAYDTTHVKLVVRLLLPCTDITSFQYTHCLWHDTRQIGCPASFALHRYHKFSIYALPMTRHTSNWLFGFFCLVQISQVFNILTAYDTTHVKLFFSASFALHRYSFVFELFILYPNMHCNWCIFSEFFLKCVWRSLVWLWFEYIETHKTFFSQWMTFPHLK